MGYALRYRLPFNTALNDDVQVLIYEKQNPNFPFSGEPFILTGVNPAVTIRFSGQGDDERVKGGIFESELTINIRVGIGVNLSVKEFIAADPLYWKVDIYNYSLNNHLIFSGYLICEEMAQPLQDKPYTITLKATSGISRLKEVPLFKKFDLVDKSYDILNYLVRGLSNLQEDKKVKILTAFNIRPFNAPIKDIAPSYDTLKEFHVNAYTFLKSDGDYESCYDVVTKICEAFNLRCFFNDGVWWFVHIGEFLDDNTLSYVYYENTYDAVNNIHFVNDLDAGVKVFETKVEIGIGKRVYAISTNQVLSYKLPVSKRTNFFSYRLDPETFCNMYLKKGERVQSEDRGLHANGTPILKAHYPDCYEAVQVPYGSPIAANTKLLIVTENSEFEEEKDRWLELWPSSSTAFIKAKTFVIDKGARLNVEFSYSLESDVRGAGNLSLCYVLLFADDGSRYQLDNDLKWYPNHPSAGNNGRILSLNFSNVDDLGEWLTYNKVSGRLPASGVIGIYFAAASFTGVNKIIRFKDINFKPVEGFLSGTKVSKGHRHTAISFTDSRKSEANEIFIAESPARYLKGALLTPTGQSAPVEWRYKNALAPERLGKLLNDTAWNHTQKIRDKIEGTFKGNSYIDRGSQIKWFNLACQFIFTDHDARKYFMLSNDFEIDLQNGVFTGVFMETVSDRLNNLYEEPFKTEYEYTT